MHLLCRDFSLLSHILVRRCYVFTRPAKIKMISPNLYLLSNVKFLLYNHLSMIIETVHFHPFQTSHEVNLLSKYAAFKGQITFLCCYLGSLSVLLCYLTVYCYVPDICQTCIFIYFSLKILTFTFPVKCQDLFLMHHGV